MEKPNPEYFTEANTEMVNFHIGQFAIDYSSALEAMETYQRQNDPEAKAGRVRKILKDPTVNELYSDLGTMLGQDFMSGFVDDLLVKDARSSDEVQISTQDNDKSKNVLQSTSIDLADIVCYLQEYSKDKIVNYGLSDTEQEADAMAWKGTWSRLVSTIKPIGGVVLADIASMFDALVQLRYPLSYDPVDPQRGREARADVSASTFYDVFSPHLNRAITRSGEDNWTGH